MGLANAEAYPATDLLELAEDAAGVEIREPLRRNRPLRRTSVLQPALTAVSLGALGALLAGGLKFDAVAGHSLGEVAAFSAAGCFCAASAVGIAARRGQIMEARAGQCPGGMWGVGRADEGDVHAALASELRVALAARNGPRSWSLCGPVDSLRRVGASLGGKALSVSGPWHHPDMAPARDAFLDALAGVEFNPSQVALVGNAEGAPIQGTRRELAEQLAQPIQWSATLQTLSDVEAFVIVGPGRVLRALLRQHPATRDAAIYTTDTPRDLEHTLEALT